VELVPGGRRQWGLMVWCGALLLMPVVGISTVTLTRYYFGSSPTNLQRLSTPQLLQQQLPGRVEEPWVWNELQSRLLTKSLSQQDVDSAINVLISQMKSKQPNGWDQPLSWQNDFVASARQANLISGPVQLALCNAFYGPKPVIQPLPRVREDADYLEITVEYGNNWSEHSGIGIQLLWEVKQVRLDGKPLEILRTQKHAQRWSGYYHGDLEPGNHDLAIDVHCAYFDQSKLIGLDVNTLRAAAWPKARKRWMQTVSAPLKVYTKTEPTVRLTTDPEKDPLRTGGIKIQRFVVQADGDWGKKIILRVDYSAGLAIPLSCDVAAVVDGQEAELGWQWVVQNESGRSRGGNELSCQIGALDASVKYGDIVFKPNPRRVDHRPDVLKIWGQEILFKDVPLERLDLEAEQETVRE
jgi:hypothetical protein